MSDVDDDLKATAEAAAEDARRLMELEQEKAQLPADDPRVRELSDEARALGDRLAQVTDIEHQLAIIASRESDP
ncbi:MAG: hypothetical protein KF809_18475 [Chloroflexi bacterium]|nr:hypothetical protein [Chloroflexota bacterium]